MSERALKWVREAKEKRLTRLDLGNCGLRGLPDELFEWAKIKLFWGYFKLGLYVFKNFLIFDFQNHYLKPITNLIHLKKEK